MRAKMNLKKKPASTLIKKTVCLLRPQKPLNKARSGWFDFCTEPSPNPVTLTKIIYRSDMKLKIF